jgi:hypothetical protein
MIEVMGVVPSGARLSRRYAAEAPHVKTSAAARTGPIRRPASEARSDHMAMYSRST